MNRGIIYYNKGERCLIRLCVSVSSLMKVYRGPVTVLAVGDMPRWARKLLRGLGVNLHHVPDDGLSSRTTKASLWRWSPYDASLFIDADTVVLEDPSSLFDLIENNEFITTQFSNWKTTGRRMSKRIRSWASVLSPSNLQAALDYGAAVNTGVFGWKRDARILEPWERLAQIGWEANCTRRMIDELACQVLLPRYPHALTSDKWNYSVCYGVAPEPGIVHYHGNKHTGDRPHNAHWKDAYWNLRHTSRWCDALGDPHGDKALRHYLREVVRDDVTIVTVVNPAYRKKLAANWPKWMATPGLREQRFTVFAVGEPDLTFLESYRNACVIPWYDVDDSRESCLSTFVFGVAQHVGTPYWMKLDCDATPRNGAFGWPAYERYVATAHRWGYTRVKGQPNATQHWLNALDDWWGDEPLFPETIPPRSRHGHKRYNSFCCIYKTDFTRKVAERCGGRLPVPSEDTTTWYTATRWGLPINRVNMKRWLSQ